MVAAVAETWELSTCRHAAPSADSLESALAAAQFASVSSSLNLGGTGGRRRGESRVSSAKSVAAAGAGVPARAAAEKLAVGDMNATERRSEAQRRQGIRQLASALQQQGVPGPAFDAWMRRALKVRLDHEMAGQVMSHG